jgi:DNA-binding transcriptional MocR family regulator
MGSEMYYVGTPVQNEFVVGFAAASERVLREAIRRLAAGG